MKNGHLKEKTTHHALPQYAQLTQGVPVPTADVVSKQETHDKNLLLWCDENLVAQKLADFFVE